MKVMLEEWKIKGKLLQELDTLRSRVAQLEQAAHKKTEEEPKESGRSFRHFFDNAAEGMLLVDVENEQFVAGNKTICRKLGWNLEEIRNMGVTDIYSKEDLDHVIEEFEKQTNREFVLVKNFPVKKSDGSIFFADITSVPLTLAGRRHMMSVFKETSPKMVKSILQQSASSEFHANQSLTATEIKVLRSIANGMSNKEISQLFHRSIRTIQNHRAHLMKKLGVDNSVELVTRAAMIGLVNLPVKQNQDKAT